MDTPIQSLSLCSGAGMLDEGVRAACEQLGWSHRCLGYVEREAYAANCLLARMEESTLEPSPVFCGNLEGLDAGSFRGWCNLITAGFPCQPWSVAGKQKGRDDDRWLWPSIKEVIRQVGPRFVFLENVPGIVSQRGIQPVLGSLAEMGFDAEWCCLSAGSVGASHKRERFFLLADSGREQQQLQQRSQRFSEHSGSGEKLVNAGSERWSERGMPLQRSGDKPPAGQTDDTCERCCNLEHTECEGPQGEGLAVPVRDGKSGSPGGDRADVPLFAPGPGDFDGWGRVVEDGSFDFRAPSIKPGVCVLVDGVALVVDESRADQLRCGGNGVVPLQAAVAFIHLYHRLSE